MCQVLGRILGAVADSTQPLLSSKIVEHAIVEPTISFVAKESSCRRALMGMRSLADCDRAMYSASVVLSATLVCIFEHQITGHEAKVITYPVRDLTDEGHAEVAVVQVPAKSAST